MRKLLLFVSLLLATLAAKATEPKIVTFSATNLTHTHVTTALNAKGITTEPWIAVLASSVKTLEAAGITGTFRADYGDARCVNLRSVQGGEGLTSIGDYAFRNCTNLSSASFPVATSIGDYAFRNCTNLSSASFPVATGIGNGAFYGCTSLSSASFPKVTIISNYAFYGCSNLSSASFPKVTDIGEEAFGGCTSLSTLSLGTALSSETDITFGDNVFLNVTTTNIDLTLGENVTITNTELAKKLYKGYTFKSIVGGRAVPEKIITFTEANLTHTHVKDSLDKYNIANYEPWIAVLASTVKTLETVDDTGTFYAYDGDSRCKNLQSVEGSEGVTSIGKYAFGACTNLTSVFFPMATSIGNYAFRNCTNLTSVSFPVAESIGEAAFWNCTSLSSASFPMVTDIADLAFAYCTSLSTLSIGTALSTETDITFGSDVFKSVTTENIDLTLGEKVDVSGANTNIANKHYKGYTFKSIKQSNTSSINETEASFANATVVGYYSIQGHRLQQAPERGLYLEMYSNGRAKKMVK